MRERKRTFDPGWGIWGTHGDDREAWLRDASGRLWQGTKADAENYAAQNRPDAPGWSYSAKALDDSALAPINLHGGITDEWWIVFSAQAMTVCAAEDAAWSYAEEMNRPALVAHVVPMARVEQAVAETNAVQAAWEAERAGYDLSTMLLQRGRAAEIAARERAEKRAAAAEREQGNLYAQTVELKTYITSLLAVLADAKKDLDWYQKRDADGDPVCTWCMRTKSVHRRSDDGGLHCPLRASIEPHLYEAPELPPPNYEMMPMSNIETPPAYAAEAPTPVTTSRPIDEFIILYYEDDDAKKAIASVYFIDDEAAARETAAQFSDRRMANGSPPVRIIRAMSAETYASKFAEWERVLDAATSGRHVVVRAPDRPEGDIDVWSDNHPHAFSPTSRVTRLQEAIDTAHATLDEVDEREGAWLGDRVKRVVNHLKSKKAILAATHTLMSTLGQSIVRLRKSIEANEGVSIPMDIAVELKILLEFNTHEAISNLIEGRDYDLERAKSQEQQSTAVAEQLREENKKLTAQLEVAKKNLAGYEKIEDWYAESVKTRGEALERAVTLDRDLKKLEGALDAANAVSTSNVEDRLRLESVVEDLKKALADRIDNSVEKSVHKESFRVMRERENLLRDAMAKAAKGLAIQKHEEGCLDKEENDSHCCVVAAALDAIQTGFVKCPPFEKIEMDTALIEHADVRPIVRMAHEKAAATIELRRMRIAMDLAIADIESEMPATATHLLREALEGPGPSDHCRLHGDARREWKSGEHHEGCEKHPSNAAKSKGDAKAPLDELILVFELYQAWQKQDGDADSFVSWIEDEKRTLDQASPRVPIVEGEAAPARERTFAESMHAIGDRMRDGLSAPPQIIGPDPVAHGYITIEEPTTSEKTVDPISESKVEAARREVMTDAHRHLIAGRVAAARGILEIALGLPQDPNACVVLGCVEGKDHKGKHHLYPRPPIDPKLIEAKRLASEVCVEIEKLPASTEQTNLSVKASNVVQAIQHLTEPHLYDDRVPTSAEAGVLMPDEGRRCERCGVSRLYHNYVGSACTEGFVEPGTIFGVWCEDTKEHVGRWLRGDSLNSKAEYNVRDAEEVARSLRNDAERAGVRHMSYEARWRKLS